MLDSYRTSSMPKKKNTIVHGSMPAIENYQNNSIATGELISNDYKSDNYNMRYPQTAWQNSRNQNGTFSTIVPQN